MSYILIRGLDFIATSARELLITLFVLLASVFVWFCAQEYHVYQVQTASIAYYHLIHKQASTIADYQNFVDQQPSTIYSTFSLLKMAQMYAKEQNFDAADSALVSALSHVADTKLRGLIIHNRAKLALNQSAPQHCLDILKGITPAQKSRAVAVTELEALSALGEIDKFNALLSTLQAQLDDELATAPSREASTLAQLLQVMQSRTETN